MCALGCAVRGLSRSTSNSALFRLLSVFGQVGALERRRSLCFVDFQTRLVKCRGDSEKTLEQKPCAAYAALSAIRFLKGAQSGCRGAKQLDVHLAKVSAPLPFWDGDAFRPCECLCCSTASALCLGEIQAACEEAFVFPPSTAFARVRGDDQPLASQEEERRSLLSPLSFASSSLSQTAAAREGGAGEGEDGGCCEANALTPFRLRHLSAFVSLLHGQTKNLKLLRLVLLLLRSGEGAGGGCVLCDEELSSAASARQTFFTPECAAPPCRWRGAATRP